MKKIHIQQQELNTGLILEDKVNPGDGSDILFCGRVRNNSKGKNVLHIDYQVYPEMAIREMDKIADEAIAKWKLNRCVIVHRYGRVMPGEISIVILVSSPHREESYISSKYIIDEIKKRVPVWKKECYDDGSEWIGDRN
ncbi:MAG TPA: molybdenum cofactor biosynthesis protein MoaE [Spirochaetota bacterium]|nr:molybdenum cofactor biosynthesis protein MoaE [Spirochaetota bacterium]HQO39295.1 molybdenum cofactor biosynthesis protein MoaE [Spirochaetota bacterium]